MLRTGKRTLARPVDMVCRQIAHYRATVKLNAISEQGDDFRTPVVMVHGLFGSSSNWRSIMKSCNKLSVSSTGLASMGSSMATPFYALDLRNHGSSEHADCMNLNVLADDLARFLDDIDVDKAMLIGHGLGGCVAMATALRHDERVDRLMVVGAAPAGTANAGSDEQQPPRAVLEAMLAMPLDEVTTRKSANGLLQAVGVTDGGLRQFVLQNLVIHRDRPAEWRINLAALDREWDALTAAVATSVHAEVEPFDGEVLFLHGSESTWCDAAPDCKSTAALFPRARFESLPAGHWVHLERPAEFIDAVMRFIA